MRKMISVPVGGVMAFLAFAQPGWGGLRPSVIYGEDNRVDMYEVRDQAWLDLGRSTVALVKSAKLKKSGELFDLTTSSFGTNYCKDERFAGQPTGAFCSGFLVAPNLVATAGHCISDQDCDTISFVFDFAMDNETTAHTRFERSQVYSCKNVVKSVQMNSGQDFALVELDRNVEGRAPLKLRSAGELAVGDELTLIGHPSGLPLKLADGAAVRRWAMDKSYFVANTDSYGGNSGSAVFNSRTMEVEGILVRGENDFEYDWKKRCTHSVVCKDDECRGEDVTAIRYVAELVNERAKP